MRYSQLFGKTIKNVPKDATLVSHQLLYKAGFIRESTAGRYYLLPLGLRVQQKIQQIIKEEMDKTGAQELAAPVLHPIALWKETNRTTSVGFELMTVKDRNEMEFVLGGTAEEMIVDLMRKFQISYKDLPLNLYQFSTKFRDELRARGGLLRVREFVMKDAYSFDISEEEFKKEYQKMWQTYTEIYEKMGLKTTVVESDNGYIGGEYCHEFVVESEVGESMFLVSADGYAAHEDIAKFIPDKKNVGEVEKELEEVDAVRGTTMEDGVKFHNLPLWQQIKDVLFVDEQGRFILAIIRGDYDVNEVKLLHAIKAYQLRHATDEEIRNKIHSEPGFISPVGIKDIVNKGVELIVVADDSLSTIRNAYGGSNKKNKDLLNMNMGRDFKADIKADIALAREGYQAFDGSGLLQAKKGIEVGNIFQLGFHYSSKMEGATFIDKEGKPQPYYMGCYGIGLGRTLATLVEVFHDEKGIIWPESVAPYQVHLIHLGGVHPRFAKASWGESATPEVSAEEIYEKLQKAEVEVLYDDRVDVSAGEKFADCDLIGIPVRLVVSEKSGDKIEWKNRRDEKTELLTFDQVVKRLHLRV